MERSSGELGSGQAIAEAIFANEADPAFRRRALWIGESLANRFQEKPFRLIDIGCGRGFYLPLYAALGARVTGVELDAEARAIAELRSRGTDSRIVAARAEELPFDDASFDALVMSEVLEHLEAPAKALTEAHRVLSAGGILLVTVPHANYPFSWDPVNFVLERTIGRPIRSGPLAGIWANHHRLYRPSQLHDEVAGIGFTVTDVFTHTSRCLPFVHNIVYGLGRLLLEKHLLPSGWAKSAERSAGQAKGINPVHMGIALIQWVDRRNADRAAPGERAQNICLAALKPGSGAA